MEDFDAFITYSRQDVAFAAWLEQALEGYRSPAGVASRRRLHIFRDVSDLVGNELPPAIRAALDRSRCLVVACSPDARRSTWVGREIDAFAGAHGRDGIIPVLVAGRPDHEVAPTDPVQDQAFPASLHRHLDEPLAADFRVPAGASWRRRRAARREALFSVLASLLEVDKETLLRRQEARTRRRLGVAVVVSVLATLAFAWIALEATRARATAERERLRAVSRLLSFQATSLVDREIDLSLLLAVEAYRRYGGVDALSSLLAALQHDARLHTVLRGHEKEISSLAFSPDGTRLASGSADRTVRVWDVEARRAIGTPLRGHEGGVLGIAFAPDGRRLFSAGEDAVRMWDLDTGEAARDPLPVLTKQIVAAAFSPDATRLALADHFFITVWDLDAWAPIGRPIRGGDRWVMDVALNRDGTRLVSGHLGGGIRTWDVNTGRASAVGETAAEVLAVAYSPDGKHLASGTNWVRLWDATSGQLRGAPQHAHDGNVTGLAFRLDGARLVSGGTDGVARVWDVVSWQPVGAPLRHQAMVRGFAFTPDGRRLATASGADVMVWELEARARLERSLPAGERPWSVAVSPDGSRMVAGLENGRVQLWDLPARRSIGSPVSVLPERETVHTARFSPDGTRLAFAGHGVVRVSDAGTLEPRGELVLDDAALVPPLAFSPNGQLLAAGEVDGRVRLWDAGTLESLGPPLRGHDRAVLSVAFRADGARLASGSGDGTVRLWDVERRAPIGEQLRGHTDAVVGLTFLGADERKLLSVDHEGGIRLWDATTGQPIGQPQYAGGSRLLAVAFERRAPWIACLNGRAGTLRTAEIRLWSTMATQPLDGPLSSPALDGSSPAKGSLAFTPDGKQMVSANAGDQLLLWDVDPASWLAEACRIANRNLTRTEWDRYLGAEAPYRCSCVGLPAGTGVAVPPEGCEGS